MIDQAEVGSTIHLRKSAGKRKARAVENCGRILKVGRLQRLGEVDEASVQRPSWPI